jgi:hypothetical protein
MRAFRPALLALLLCSLEPAAAPGRAFADEGAGRCAEAVIAHAPARRLTRVEYDNSVQDLLGLGPETRPAEAFPTDDSVAGFDTNSLGPPTRVALERAFAAAEALAEVADVRRLAACADPGLAGGGGPRAGARPAWGTPACARRFVATFLHRAFRRPPAPAERARFERAFVRRRRAAGFEAGLRVVIAGALASPSFLYRGPLPAAPGAGARQPLSGPELAARLSYFLWASTPDDALLAAAEAGALAYPGTLEAEARRLLADARAGRAWTSFYRQWLGLGRDPDKSRRAYPVWSASLWRSMLGELDAFVEHLRATPSLEALLLAPYSFIDARLAEIYGVPPPAEPGFRRVDLPAAERAGVLTQPAFLTANAFPDQPSPIHRGKFVRENLLCQTVPEPPDGLDITPPKVDPKKPAKERFEDHRLQGVCSRCHELMDPIGFAFQHYDGIGRWQTRDGEHAVDAVGEIAGAGDIDGEVDGALELARRLAASPVVHRCLARQWVRFALGRADAPGEACFIDRIQERFTARGLDLRELLVAVATSDLFRFRGLPAPDAATGAAPAEEPSAR